jgi:hypothetical protein
MQDEFSRLGLSVPELYAAAVENLAALPSASISIGNLPGGYEGWLSAKETTLPQREFCVHGFSGNL